MDRFSFAALGLTAVLLSLNIFSYFKKLNMLTKITAFLLMPLTGTYAVLYLVQFFPDSINVTTLTILSFILSSLCVIFNSFEKNALFIVITRIFFLLSQFCWVQI